MPDPTLRAAFLEALLGLTRYPSLEVLGAAIPAWPGLLRGRAWRIVLATSSDAY